MEVHRQRLDDGSGEMFSAIATILAVVMIINDHMETRLYCGLGASSYKMLRSNFLYLMDQINASTQLFNEGLHTKNGQSGAV